METEVWLEENEDGKENDLLGMKPSKAERAIVITEGLPRGTREVKEEEEESREEEA